MSIEPLTPILLSIAGKLLIALLVPLLKSAWKRLMRLRRKRKAQRRAPVQ